MNAMSSSQSAQSTKMKDFLIYIAVGVLIVVVITSLAFHEAKKGHTSGFPIKWLGFAIMTALVFGNIIRYSRQLRHLANFWALFGILLLGHLGLGVLILRRIDKIGLIHFAIATPIEYFALTVCLTYFVTQKTRNLV